MPLTAEPALEFPLPDEPDPEGERLRRVGSALLILLDEATESDIGRLCILGAIVETVLRDYEGKMDKESAAAAWIAELTKRLRFKDAADH